MDTDADNRKVRAKTSDCGRILLLLPTILLYSTAFLCLYAFSDTPHAARGDLWRAEATAAVAASNGTDAVARLAALSKLRADFPENSRVLRNVAGAELKVGNTGQARKELGEYAAMGMTINPGTAIYEALASSGILESVPELRRNQAPVVGGVRVFSFSDPDLITEDVAFDPTTRHFFVTSVRKKKILECDHSGHCRDAIASTPELPLDAMLAIHIDPARKILWATTAGMEAQDGFVPQRKGHSSLLKFDLKTFRLIKRYEPSDGKEHALGDMTTASNGDVYVSDGESGDVYVVGRGLDQLEQLVSSSHFVSPQTPALNDREDLLYVPDYSMGIAAIDLSAKAVGWVTITSPQALEGIDGLYWRKGDLITIQNGTMPERITRFHLHGRSSVSSSTVLDANFPALGDPTHGVLVGDDFYFIVNSGWNRVSDTGTLAPGSAAEIWKLTLPTRADR